MSDGKIEEITDEKQLLNNKRDKSWNGLIVFIIDWLIRGALLILTLLMLVFIGRYLQLIAFPTIFQEYKAENIIVAKDTASNMATVFTQISGWLVSMLLFFKDYVRQNRQNNSDED